MLLAILNCEQKYLEKNKKKVMVFSMCWVAAARDVVDLMAVESLETVHKIVERSWMGIAAVSRLEQNMPATHFVPVALSHLSPM